MTNCDDGVFVDGLLGKRCGFFGMHAWPITNRYWQNNRWDFIKTNDTITVHPLDGEIYAQIINLSCAYVVYFHGYHEVPDIAKQRYDFPAGDYTTVEMLALEILTSSSAKS